MMIYTNFLYFIVAIALYMHAPVENITGNVSNLVITLILLILFANFNKLTFTKLKNDFYKREKSSTWVRNENNKFVIYNSLISIIIFGVELFTLNLKKVFTQIPLLGSSETIVDFLGVCFFMLHLSIVWYYSSSCLKGIASEFNPPLKYVYANFKFNLVIVIPWLVFTFLKEVMLFLFPVLLGEIWDSTLFNFGLMLVFLIIISVFVPLFILFLWDCKPIQDREKYQEIKNFLAQHKVKFYRVLSWNALNSSIISAAVVGLAARFRLLLITPRLIQILNTEELIAVVGHEIGHVKKKHMYYYLLFFFMFFILSFGMLNLVIQQILHFSNGGINFRMLQFIIVFVSVLFFILFFRFVFSYFMRNFERQADLFCFEIGVNPDYLISAFEKLQQLTNESSKKKNWHHYNISQRVETLRQAKEDNGLIKKQEKQITKRIIGFLLAVILIFSFSIGFNGKKTDVLIQLSYLIQQVEKYPQNTELKNQIGMHYYEVENWGKTVEYYTKSLKLNYNQPLVLNNLSWLLLKCPDQNFRHPDLALKYAKYASQLEVKSYILDTLAEAFLQNDMPKEALKASKEAFNRAPLAEKKTFLKRYNEIKQGINESDIY